MLIKGESQKLGTCENLYYATHKALIEVMPFAQQEEGNGQPTGYCNR